MDHFPGTSWGKPREDPYATFPVSSAKHLNNKQSSADGVQHTQQPIVTGTSVLGIKYKGGVMLAADMLASYGSLARFKDIRRLVPVGEHTVIGAGGDLSDFQYIQKVLEARMTEEVLADDGHILKTPQIFEYLARIMYNRRTKGNPLWNSFVVGGFDKATQEGFLSYVDLIGTTYSAPSIATGYGSYIAQPLLRKVLDDLPNGHLHLTPELARKTLEESMKVLFYRDARSLNKFQIANITADGVEISEPIQAPTEWAFAEGLRGFNQSPPTNPSSSAQTHDQGWSQKSIDNKDENSSQEDNSNKPLPSSSQPPIKPKKKLDRQSPTCSACRKQRTWCDRGRPCSECYKRNMACNYSEAHYTSIAEQVDREEYIERLEARIHALEGPTPK